AVFANARRLYLSKDWLRSRLTGDWHSDFSDAVGALMADVATGGWSAELCDLVGWPTERLPPLAAPQAVVGRVTAAAARDCGLVAGTPVVCGSNDTTVEFFGAGAVRPGQGAIKLATAGVLFLCTEGPRINPPVSCYPHLLPGLCYTASGTNSCASAHRWLRDVFFPGESFAAMDELAAAVPPGADGCLFHPYLLGERAPYWDAKLRARFLGLTMRHGKAHIARATYEGIAFSIRDLRDSSPDRQARFDEIRLLGGGARSVTWRQVLADVMGVEMVRPANGDASFGAALVAGIGTGVFADADDAIARAVRVLDCTAPDAGRVARYDELFGIYKDAQGVLADIDHRLHRFAHPG
ncbi:MAG: xylulokinase, partial [Planctomycetes bacterium]|nr:xylulokinase [Planctomycetota bacterium]